MKKSIFEILKAVSLALVVAGLASCASSSNPAESQPFDGSTAGTEEEGIYDKTPETSGASGIASEPLPERDEKTNPDNADYETLNADTVYFAFDSYSIEASQRHKVENAASWMKENFDKKVIVAGHCDNRGTTQYNLALGERRALAIRDYLVGLGVEKDRINTISYGKERPAVSGESEEAWAKNRRGQIGVLR